MSEEQKRYTAVTDDGEEISKDNLEYNKVYPVIDRTTRQHTGYVLRRPDGSVEMQDKWEDPQLPAGEQLSDMWTQTKMTMGTIANIPNSIGAHVFNSDEDQEDMRNREDEIAKLQASRPLSKQVAPGFFGDRGQITPSVIADTGVKALPFLGLFRGVSAGLGLAKKGADVMSRSDNAAVRAAGKLGQKTVGGNFQQGALAGVSIVPPTVAADASQRVRERDGNDNQQRRAGQSAMVTSMPIHIASGAIMNQAFRMAGRRGSKVPVVRAEGATEALEGAAEEFAAQTGVQEIYDDDYNTTEIAEAALLEGIGGGVASGLWTAPRRIYDVLTEKHEPGGGDTSRDKVTQATAEDFVKAAADRKEQQVRPIFTEGVGHFQVAAAEQTELYKSEMLDADSIQSQALVKNYQSLSKTVAEMLTAGTPLNGEGGVMQMDWENLIETFPVIKDMVDNINAKEVMDWRDNILVKMWNSIAAGKDKTIRGVSELFKFSIQPASELEEVALAEVNEMFKPHGLNYFGKESQGVENIEELARRSAEVIQFVKNNDIDIAKVWEDATKRAQEMNTGGLAMTDSLLRQKSVQYSQLRNNQQDTAGRVERDVAELARNMSEAIHSLSPERIEDGQAITSQDDIVAAASDLLMHLGKGRGERLDPLNAHPSSSQFAGEPLATDPEIFQHKRNTDKDGVSTPIEGDYNPNKAGFITVWERSDGQRFIAHGHHRYQKAKESAQANPVMRIDARILREDEGYTVDHVKSMSAVANILEGKGADMDLLETMNNADTKGIIHGYAEQGNARAINAINLSALPAEALDLVKRNADDVGKVEPDVAALVGGAGLNPALQLQSLQYFQQNPPQSAEQAAAALKSLAGEDAVNGYDEMATSMVKGNIVATVRDNLLASAEQHKTPAEGEAESKEYRNFINQASYISRALSQKSTVEEAIKSLASDVVSGHTSMEEAVQSVQDTVASLYKEHGVNLVGNNFEDVNIPEPSDSTADAAKTTKKRKKKAERKAAHIDFTPGQEVEISLRKFQNAFWDAVLQTPKSAKLSDLLRASLIKFNANVYGKGQAEEKTDEMFDSLAAEGDNWQDGMRGDTDNPQALNARFIIASTLVSATANRIGFNGRVILRDAFYGKALGARGRANSRDRNVERGRKKKVNDTDKIVALALRVGHKDMTVVHTFIHENWHWLYPLLPVGQRKSIAREIFHMQDMFIEPGRTLIQAIRHSLGPRSRRGFRITLQGIEKHLNNMDKKTDIAADEGVAYLVDFAVSRGITGEKGLADKNFLDTIQRKVNEFFRKLKSTLDGAGLLTLEDTINAFYNGEFADIMRRNVSMDNMGISSVVAKALNPGFRRKSNLFRIDDVGGLNMRLPSGWAESDDDDAVINGENFATSERFADHDWDAARVYQSAGKPPEMPPIKGISADIMPVASIKKNPGKYFPGITDEAAAWVQDFLNTPGIPKSMSPRAVYDQASLRASPIGVAEDGVYQGAFDTNGEMFAFKSKLYPSLKIIGEMRDRYPDGKISKKIINAEILPKLKKAAKGEITSPSGYAYHVIKKVLPKIPTNRFDISELEEAVEPLLYFYMLETHDASNSNYLIGAFPRGEFKDDAEIIDLVVSVRTDDGVNTGTTHGHNAFVHIEGSNDMKVALTADIQTGLGSSSSPSVFNNVLDGREYGGRTLMPSEKRANEKISSAKKYVNLIVATALNLAARGYEYFGIAHVDTVQSAQNLLEGDFQFEVGDEQWVRHHWPEAAWVYEDGYSVEFERHVMDELTINEDTGWIENYYIGERDLHYLGKRFIDILGDEFDELDFSMFDYEYIIKHVRNDGVDLIGDYNKKLEEHGIDGFRAKKFNEIEPRYLIAFYGDAVAKRNSEEDLSFLNKYKFELHRRPDDGRIYWIDRDDMADEGYGNDDPFHDQTYSGFKDKDIYQLYSKDIFSHADEAGRILGLPKVNGKHFNRMGDEGMPDNYLGTDKNGRDINVSIWIPLKKIKKSLDTMEMFAVENPDASRKNMRSTTSALRKAQGIFGDGKVSRRDFDERILNKLRKTHSTHPNSPSGISYELISRVVDEMGKEFTIEDVMAGVFDLLYQYQVENIATLVGVKRHNYIRTKNDDWTQKEYGLKVILDGKKSRQLSHGYNAYGRVDIDPTGKIGVSANIQSALGDNAGGLYSLESPIIEFDISREKFRLRHILSNDNLPGEFVFLFSEYIGEGFFKRWSDNTVTVNRNGDFIRSHGETPAMDGIENNNVLLGEIKQQTAEYLKRYSDADIKKLRNEFNLSFRASKNRIVNAIQATAVQFAQDGGVFFGVANLLTAMRAQGHLWEEGVRWDDKEWVRQNHPEYLVIFDDEGINDDGVYIITPATEYRTRVHYVEDFDVHDEDPRTEEEIEDEYYSNHQVDEVDGKFISYMRSSVEVLELPQVDSRNLQRDPDGNVIYRGGIEDFMILYDKFMPRHFRNAAEGMGLKVVWPGDEVEPGVFVPDLTDEGIGTSGMIYLPHLKSYDVEMFAIEKPDASRKNMRPTISALRKARGIFGDAKVSRKDFDERILNKLQKTYKTHPGSPSGVSYIALSKALANMGDEFTMEQLTDAVVDYVYQYTLKKIDTGFHNRIRGTGEGWTQRNYKFGVSLEGNPATVDAHGFPSFGRVDIDPTGKIGVSANIQSALGDMNGAMYQNYYGPEGYGRYEIDGVKYGIGFMYRQTWDNPFDFNIQQHGEGTTPKEFSLDKDMNLVKRYPKHDYEFTDGEWTVIKKYAAKVFETYTDEYIEKIKDEYRASGMGSKNRIVNTIQATAIQFHQDGGRWFGVADLLTAMRAQGYLSQPGDDWRSRKWVRENHPEMLFIFDDTGDYSKGENFIVFGLDESGDVGYVTPEHYRALTPEEMEDEGLDEDDFSSEYWNGKYIIYDEDDVNVFSIPSGNTDLKRDDDGNVIYQSFIKDFMILYNEYMPRHFRRAAEGMGVRIYQPGEEVSPGVFAPNLADMGVGVSGFMDLDGLTNYDAEMFAVDENIAKYIEEGPDLSGVDINPSLKIISQMRQEFPDGKISKKIIESQFLPKLKKAAGGNIKSPSGYAYHRLKQVMLTMPDTGKFDIDELEKMVGRFLYSYNLWGEDPGGNDNFIEGLGGDKFDLVFDVRTTAGSNKGETHNMNAFAHMESDTDGTFVITADIQTGLGTRSIPSRFPPGEDFNEEERAAVELLASSQKYVNMLTAMMIKLRKMGYRYLGIAAPETVRNAQGYGNSGMFAIHDPDWFDENYPDFVWMKSVGYTPVGDRHVHVIGTKEYQNIGESGFVEAEFVDQDSLHFGGKTYLDFLKPEFNGVNFSKFSTALHPHLIEDGVEGVSAVDYYNKQLQLHGLNDGSDIGTPITDISQGHPRYLVAFFGDYLANWYGDEIMQRGDLDGDDMFIHRMPGDNSIYWYFDYSIDTEMLQDADVIYKNFDRLRINKLYSRDMYGHVNEAAKRLGMPLLAGGNYFYTKWEDNVPDLDEYSDKEGEPIEINIWINLDSIPKDTDSMEMFAVDRTADESTGERFALVPPEESNAIKEDIMAGKDAWDKLVDGDYSPESIADALDNNKEKVRKIWKKYGILLGVDGRFRAEVHDEMITEDFIRYLRLRNYWHDDYVNMADAMLEGGFIERLSDIPRWMLDVEIMFEYHSEYDEDVEGDDYKLGGYGVDGIISMKIPHGDFEYGLAENVDTLVHELQHRVQHFFQFDDDTIAKGTSTAREDTWNTLIETEARDVSARHFYTAKQRRDMFPMEDDAAADIILRGERFAIVSPTAAKISRRNMRAAAMMWKSRLGDDFSKEAITDVLANDKTFVKNVWKNYGIILGIDGLYRSEIHHGWINDEFINKLARRLAGVSNRPIKLTSLHKEVPDYLRDIKFKPNNEVATGYYSPQNSTIQIPRNIAKNYIAGNEDDEFNMKEFILHEMQHHVQTMFGMMDGASADEVIKHVRSAYMEEVADRIRSVPKGQKRLYRNYMAVKFYQSAVGRLKQHKPRTTFIKDVDDAHAKTWSKEAFKSALTDYETRKILEEDAIHIMGYLDYHQNFGEAEAREIRLRHDKSASWRATHPPSWAGIPAKQLMLDNEYTFTDFDEMFAKASNEPLPSIGGKTVQFVTIAPIKKLFKDKGSDMNATVSKKEIEQIQSMVENNISKSYGKERFRDINLAYRSILKDVIEDFDGARMSFLELLDIVDHKIPIYIRQSNSNIGSHNYTGKMNGEISELRYGLSYLGHDSQGYTHGKQVYVRMEYSPDGTVAITANAQRGDHSRGFENVAPIPSEYRKKFGNYFLIDGYYYWATVRLENVSNEIAMSISITGDVNEKDILGGERFSDFINSHFKGDGPDTDVMVSYATYSGKTPRKKLIDLVGMRKNPSGRRKVLKWFKEKEKLLEPVAAERRAKLRKFDRIAEALEHVGHKNMLANAMLDAAARGVEYFGIVDGHEVYQAQKSRIPDFTNEKWVAAYYPEHMWIHEYIGKEVEVEIDERERNLFLLNRTVTPESEPGADVYNEEKITGEFTDREHFLRIGQYSFYSITGGDEDGIVWLESPDEYSSRALDEILFFVNSHALKDVADEIRARGSKTAKELQARGAHDWVFLFIRNWKDNVSKVIKPGMKIYTSKYGDLLGIAKESKVLTKTFSKSDVFDENGILKDSEIAKMYHYAMPRAFEDAANSLGLPKNKYKRRTYRPGEEISPGVFAPDYQSGRTKVVRGKTVPDYKKQIRVSRWVVLSQLPDEIDVELFAKNRDVKHIADSPSPGRMTDQQYQRMTVAEDQINTGEMPEEDVMSRLASELGFVALDGPVRPGNDVILISDVTDEEGEFVRYRIMHARVKGTYDDEVVVFDGNANKHIDNRDFYSFATFVRPHSESRNKQAAKGGEFGDIPAPAHAKVSQPNTAPAAGAPAASTPAAGGIGGAPANSPTEHPEEPQKIADVGVNDGVVSVNPPAGATRNQAALIAAAAVNITDDESTTITDTTEMRRALFAHGIKYKSSANGLTVDTNALRPFVPPATLFQ